MSKKKDRELAVSGKPFRNKSIALPVKFLVTIPEDNINRQKRRETLFMGKKEKQ